MNSHFYLLAALCLVHPALRAEEDALTGAPRIVPGTFAATDVTAQPVAVWLEQGHGRLVAADLIPDEAGSGNAALALPAQQPAARACLLLDAPEAQLASLRFRLKLETVSVGGTVAGEGAQPPPTSEILEWELAGVPIRLKGGTAGRWQVEFYAVESGWVHLLAVDGEDLESGAGWHTLTLEFSPLAAASTLSRQWRLRWDEQEPGPWVAQARVEPPLLVMGGGLHTALWLDDFTTTAPSIASIPQGVDPAETITLRNAALRREIAAALCDLERETGVRRQRLRRVASPVSTIAPSPERDKKFSVLTPLENEQSGSTTQ